MKQILASIMTVMMLVFMFFSAFFIAEHIHHDCCGEDCPVCASIQQCEHMLRGFDDGLSAAGAILLPLLLAVLILPFFSNFFAGDTPVSKKVRMNN
ncbi:MAG: hypothetical protein K5739_00795 [Lachnospiraceae bacterium]|nr:hypothetical protein [Lachnospiraceae bacterium]